jgi:hypothetical protein
MVRRATTEATKGLKKAQEESELERVKEYLLEGL